MAVSATAVSPAVSVVSLGLGERKVNLPPSFSLCFPRYLPKRFLLSRLHRYDNQRPGSELLSSYPWVQARVVRRPNVVEILEERGLLESLTNDARRTVCSDLNHAPLRVYCGFDPMAESLHLGNLLAIIVLCWFLRCGHSAVALLGGATAFIGDPSGEIVERPRLEPQTLERNTNSMSATIQCIVARAGFTSSFHILNNCDWWNGMGMMHFLDNASGFFRVESMLSNESISDRIESEQGMSFAEFNYQLLQGYDFFHLFCNENVSVQIGGSDQLGNITAGIKLISKVLSDDGVYGLTFPLLLKRDGTKFGKSEEGSIWLSPSVLPPFKFYQCLFSVPDADVVKFLKILTFLSMEEIAQLEKDMQSPGYVPNTAQRKLAEEVTRFVHGEEPLNEARRATEALRPGAESLLNWKTIEGIAENVPSRPMAYNQVLGLSLLDLSITIGLLGSKSAARRLLKQGGLYLNNNRVDSEFKKIEAHDIIDGKVIILSSGKKNKIVVRVT